MTSVSLCLVHLDKTAPDDKRTPEPFVPQIPHAESGLVVRDKPPTPTVDEPIPHGGVTPFPLMPAAANSAVEARDTKTSRDIARSLQPPPLHMMGESSADQISDAPPQPEPPRRVPRREEDAGVTLNPDIDLHRMTLPPAYQA